MLACDVEDPPKIASSVDLKPGLRRGCVLAEQLGDVVDRVEPHSRLSILDRPSVVLSPSRVLVGATKPPGGADTERDSVGTERQPGHDFEPAPAPNPAVPDLSEPTNVLAVNKRQRALIESDIHPRM